MTNARTRFMISGLLGLMAACIPLQPIHAQNRTLFNGARNAGAYAYGLAPSVPPLIIDIGSTATGAATLTVSYGTTTAGDGTVFAPLATNAPILVGNGSNQETVTPTAVSCSTPSQYDTCTVTATYTKTHGRGESIMSASMGLQEAINLQFAGGGGNVALDSAWQLQGGTTAMITAAAGFYNVSIQDNRATGTNFWTLQPTTLTSLAAPATLTGTTAAFSASPAGTWTAAAQFLCITYVDALGGEGPCSATFNSTPAGSTSLTILAPAASTGAVGWRAYGGATYNGAFLLPVTSSVCTLTTLETLLPACAMTSNGLFLSIFVNTTTLRPQAQSPTVNLNLPFPQGHTTFGYQPSGTVSQPFQSHYGPFPAFGSLTAGQIAVVGSFNLPTGFLNTIGRTVRISGKLTLGSVNTATLPTLAVQLGWVGGTTAGAPVSVCVFSGAATGSTVVYNMPFTCTVTTNAVGATAIGSLMPDGTASVQVPTGAAIGQAYTEQAVAAIGSLGLFAQTTVSVTYTSTTNTTAAPQLLDLHVETLQ